MIKLPNAYQIDRTKLSILDDAKERATTPACTQCVPIPLQYTSSHTVRRVLPIKVALCRSPSSPFLGQMNLLSAVSTENAADGVTDASMCITASYRISLVDYSHSNEASESRKPLASPFFRAGGSTGLIKYSVTGSMRKRIRNPGSERL